MSDLEAISTFARSFMVPFNGTGDPIDFLNLLRNRVNFGTTEAQRMRMVETCMEGGALDWFNAAIRPVIQTITYEEFEQRFK